MEPLYIDPTNDTPKIIFDSKSKIFKISGRSLPDKVESFYKPVLQWLDDYKLNGDNRIEFDIMLDYFNTTSSKCLVDILIKLEIIQDKGVDVLIKWHYNKKDEYMYEAGTEFSELVNLPFELVSK